MSQLAYNPNQSGSSTAWPISAQLGNDVLVFSENYTPSEVATAWRRQRAGKIWDAILGVLTLGAFVALGVHLFYPLGNILLQFFSIGILAGLILWTRHLPKMSHGHGPDVIDIKARFSNSALEIFRTSLLASGNRQFDPLYLLLTLLKDQGTQVILYRLGLGYRDLAAATAPLLEAVPAAPPALSGDIQEIPFRAFELARKFGADIISPEILLAALISLPKESAVSRLFLSYNVKPEMVAQTVYWQVAIGKIAAGREKLYRLSGLKPKGDINRGLTSLPTPVLDSFGIDLTVRAAAGRLPIVLGREQELNLLTRTLASSGSVLIVGQTGSGKTSLVELLAQHMASEEVPESIQDKRLVRLELSRLIGQGERAAEALIACLNDAMRGSNVILAIENIHEWADVEGRGLSLLATLVNNIGEAGLPVVATTTPTYYQQTASLQSNSFFQRLDLDVMSEDDVTLAACVQASISESTSRLFWTYQAVAEAVTLSNRYLTSGSQPLKAIQVLQTVSERYGSKNGQVKVITTQEVEKVVSEMAHVDAEAVTGNEAEHLLNLEATIHSRVIGQDEAVSAVSEAMRRIKAGLQTSGKRPLASFLFAGPTGVGKTELAKALAEIEFGSDDAMVRLDLSEYNLPESVERLLGGRTHTSSFVAQLRERPYSLILLDEVEKAHPDVQNLFLQILDEGKITDNAGNKLDITNALIIATSNAAAEEIRHGFAAGTDYGSLQDKLVHDFLPQHFRAELLNRFDAIILFRPLTENEVGEVVKLQFVELNKSLAEKGITFTYSAEATAAVARAAYDQTYGARPIRRYIQDNIEDQISKLILAGQAQAGETLRLNPDLTVTVN